LIDGACSKCNDDNCDTCSSAAAGSCTVCKIGYSLLDSDKSCATSTTKIVIQLSATIRYEMTMADYVKNGGASKWIVYAAFVLGIPAKNIKITAAREGSVILDFVIGDPDAGSYEDQQKNLKDIKATLDKAVKNGDMKYEGAVILNFESGIVSASIFLFFNL